MSPQEALLQMVLGKLVSRPLYVAAKLGVADLMAGGPQTAEDMAAATKTDAPSLYRILRALASVGVFSETVEGGRRFFSLTEMGQGLRSTPGSARAMALWFGEPYHEQAWQHILHSVNTGEPGWDRAHDKTVFAFFHKHPEANQVFADAMTSLALTIHAAAVDAYDFSGFRTVVDVGGGHGALMRLILGRYPSMKGIVFDTSRVIEGTEQAIREAGMQGRCEAVVGDFFQSVPPGADAYLLSFILHDWDDERAAKILSNIAGAMKPGGKVLAIEQVVPDEPGLSFAKLIDIEMLVMTQGGRERTQREYAELFGRAGLKLGRVVPTQSVVSVLEATR